MIVGKKVQKKERNWAGLLWLLPGLLALIFFSALSHVPAWIERHYVGRIYPFFLRLSGITSQFPWPLAPWLALGAACLMALWGFTALCKALNQRSWRPFLQYVYGILVSAGLLYACFVMLWGLHYHRLPLETQLKLHVNAQSPEELRALCQDLISQANRLQKSLPLTAPNDLLERIPAAFDRARQIWPLWAEEPMPRPKASGVDPLLSLLMIEGIYSPFTMEPLINMAIPAMDLPFTACHEVAHGLGFAREEEANLIAYLVCSASEDPYFQYSGVMGALRYVLPALGTADSGGFWACMDQLSPAVRADMARRDAYWVDLQQNTVATLSQQVNDGYLTLAAQQAEGARSYGRVVDFLLALTD